MFKFIHAADVHLDSPLRGLSRQEFAPAEAIRDACRKAFENLVELALEEQVAFVLLAGDLYDGDWKDYNTGIFFSQQMGRLGRHNIPVFAVAGNHDAANQMTKALDSPANMKILSTRKVETIKLEALGVAIHGRSFGTQHVDENLAAGFAAAQKGLFNIGLLHTSLNGREGHAPYAPCTLDDLISKGYQYWALGHIHRQEFVATDPWIVFPGCLQGRHILENGAKGCVLVTVEDGAVINVAAIALDVLRWVRCGIDLTDAVRMRDVLERTRQAMETERSAADGRPLAMRMRFDGATGLSDELCAWPERLEQQVRMQAAEVAANELWIERVEIATRRKHDLDAALSDESAFGNLLRDILTTPATPEAIDGLGNVMTELRQKMPIQVFNQDVPKASISLNLNDDQTLVRLVEEAKQLLIGRLLRAGGAP